MEDEKGIFDDSLVIVPHDWTNIMRGQRYVRYLEPPYLDEDKQIIEDFVKSKTWPVPSSWPTFPCTMIRSAVSYQEARLLLQSAQFKRKKSDESLSANKSNKELDSSLISSFDADDIENFNVNKETATVQCDKTSSKTSKQFVQQQFSQGYCSSTTTIQRSPLSDKSNHNNIKPNKIKASPSQTTDAFHFKDAIIIDNDMVVDTLLNVPAISNSSLNNQLNKEPQLSNLSNQVDDSQLFDNCTPSTSHKESSHLSSMDEVAKISDLKKLEKSLKEYFSKNIESKMNVVQADLQEIKTFSFNKRLLCEQKDIVTFDKLLDLYSYEFPLKTMTEFDQFNTDLLYNKNDVRSNMKKHILSSLNTITDVQDNLTIFIKKFLSKMIVTSYTAQKKKGNWFLKILPSIKA